VSFLAARLRARLSAMPGVTVRDLGAIQCGIVTFTVDGANPEEIQRRLSERRVNVRASGPGGALLDMTARGLSGLVRASIHYYNTEEEIERFCQALESLR